MSELPRPVTFYEKTIDIGLSLNKTQADVQPIRDLARGSASQVDSQGSERTSVSERDGDKITTDALTFRPPSVTTFSMRGRTLVGRGERQCP